MTISNVTRSLLALAGLLASAIAAAAQPVKGTLPGVTNYTRVDATVGCGGATTPEAMTAIRQEGYKAVINLRLATEKDANIEAEAAAAQAAGLKYLHIPFNTSSPDPAQVELFLDAVADADNRPVYIHCASANRVGAFWLIKRVVQDGWDVERATDEASTIGLTSPKLKEFALNYLQERKR